MAVIDLLAATLLLANMAVASIADDLDMLKVSTLVLGHAERITNHRKSLKYLEKYLFPVRKTMIFPNGVKTLCLNGLNPVVQFRDQGRVYRKRWQLP